MSGVLLRQTALVDEVERYPQLFEDEGKLLVISYGGFRIGQELDTAIKTELGGEVLCADMVLVVQSNEHFLN